MRGTEDPSAWGMISRMLVGRPPGVFRRRITASTRRSPAVVSASFTYLAVAGPIAPSISIISAGLPLSSAERSAGEANWTAAAIAATRVACTILTARLPIKTIYGGSLPLPQYDRPRRTADRRQTSAHAGDYNHRRKNLFHPAHDAVANQEQGPVARRPQRHSTS